MCEIPNNVIQIDAFAQLFDGFSIGSNDLTQLTLGVDRDSEIIAFDFDERDPGMLEMLRLAVAGARRNRRHVGICGEAPANYPEIARFLTEIGVDSISVNPASLMRTIAIVTEAEASRNGAETVLARNWPPPHENARADHYQRALASGSACGSENRIRLGIGTVSSEQCDSAERPTDDE